MVRSLAISDLIPAPTIATGRLALDIKFIASVMTPSEIDEGI